MNERSRPDLRLRSPIAQHFEYVSGGGFTGPSVPASPDPLVAYRWPDPRPDDEVQIYVLRPAAVATGSPDAFDHLNSLQTDAPSVTVRGTGTIVVDFGAEYAGWFEIDSPDAPEGGFRLSVSEYNEPAQLNDDHTGKVYDKTVLPRRIGHTYRAEFNAEPHLRYEGIRFAFIHADRAEVPWHITGIRLVSQIKPANYEGSFHCDDERLNQIWYANAYALKLCNLRDYTSPILVDRSDRYLWNGMDFHIYSKVGLIAFNQYAFMRKQIEDIFLHGNEVRPGVPIDSGIFGYRLYDVLSLCQYFRYSGDADLVSRCKEEASRRLADGYDRYETYDTNVPQFPYDLFQGWDERLGGFEGMTPDNRWTYRMLCIRAWREFADILTELGDETAARRYRGWAEEKIAALRRDAEWYAGMGVHARAAAILAGFCTEEEMQAMHGGEFDDRLSRISKCQANTGYILEALGTARRDDDAICVIHDQWGALLDYGATTASAEMFLPAYAEALGTNDAPINGQCGFTSLCHPWGAMPVNYLNERVLGIRPAAPGFERVDIIPRPGGKLSLVSGTTPTPRGPVSLSFDAEQGVCEVSIPPGATARVGIPKTGRIIEEIRTPEGDTVWSRADGSFRNGWAGAEDGEYVYVLSVREGSYRFLVQYSGTRPAPLADPEIVYPAAFVREDAQTRGAWIGVYGADGYVLPGGGEGTDLVRLPDYVSSVSFHRCDRVLWADETDDERAPAAPPEGAAGSAQAPRRAAALCTKDPTATYQTMYAEVQLAGGIRSCEIALYFVDWDGASRRQAVEVIDAATLKHIAPVRVIGDFRDGKYVVFTVDRSVRIRLHTIRKPNSVLSGIFFSQGRITPQ